MRKLATIAKRTIRRGLASSNRALIRRTSDLGRPLHLDVFDTTGRIDYVRLAALELCAYEINNTDVRGAVAELGVYRGEFAAQLNLAFPDRTLYLFDTFEGFDGRQEERERAERGLTHVRDFSDTSVALVLKRMPYPDRCVVRDGLFPETARTVDDLFAFVSLDADLFEPTYDGLSYFYPRLQRGGYIFVHDYNNAHFPGVGEAVRQVRREIGISFCPLPDGQGTAIITK